MTSMFREEYLRQVQLRRKEWEAGPLRKSLDKFGKIESPNKFYTPLDASQFDFLAKVGFPGEYPFTAGTYPCSVPGSGPAIGGSYSGGGGGLVRAGRYSGYGTAEDTRDYFEKEISRGRRGGPNVAFDLPTQVGLDSDDPQSRGEVGKTGVAFDTLADFETLYEPFQGEAGLDKIASNWTINAPAAVILAAYVVLAEKRGIPQDQLRGTLQNDILKEYVARGTYIFPPRQSLTLTRDIIGYCVNSMPMMNPISVSGYHMREAGATREQTLALTLAHAMAYLQLGVDSGLDIDSLATRFTFNTLGGSMEVLKEIAVRRASRRMWARIVRERFGSRNPRSWLLREAGGIMVGCWTATKQRPLNNLTRAVIGGVAASLCGYIPTVEPPYDEPLGLGWSLEAQQLSEDAARIIQYEAKLTEVTDPFAGSYFMEALTDQVEAAASKIIDDIEGRGGVVAAVESGYLQRTIAQSAHEYQQRLERGQETIVGVNSFTGEQELEVMPARLVPYPYDPGRRIQAESRQLQRLAEVKQRRDGSRVTVALDRLREVARNENDNLMPSMIEAVRAYATIGEICGVLRQVFGEYSPQGIL